MSKANFPTPEWMLAIKDKLNSDEKYAGIAKNWEGDVRFILEPDDSLKTAMWLYFDLWHGTCPEAYVEDQTSNKTPAFVFSAPYTKFVKILSGDLGVIQALISRILNIKGSMAYMMRNVPTVLDFVRCCQEVTEGWI